MNEEKKSSSGNETSTQPITKRAHAAHFHIAKRATMPWQKAWAIRAAAILLSLVFLGILSVILTKKNPLEIYGLIFQASFKNIGSFFRLLFDTVILLAIALALLPAFKMRFWNIGAWGQVLAGAFASVLCMIFLGDKVPNVLLIIIMLVCGVGAGALWGLIPAVFKAQWGTNETLFTLMMNYVMVCIVNSSIQALYPKGTGTMGVVNLSTQAGWLPKIGNNTYLLTIIIVALLTALMFVYMRYSKHGYEISVVGESKNTANYIGINVKKVILRTMALSGAICGLTGFLLTSAYNHSVSSSVGEQGFTAIMVCWLAKFNPLFMVLTSLLINFLQRGAGEIASYANINPSYGDMIIGVVLFFILGCEFFIQYEVHFKKKEKVSENV